MKNSLKYITIFCFLAGCTTQKEYIIELPSPQSKKFGSAPRPIVQTHVDAKSQPFTRAAASQSWVARHIITEPQFEKIRRGEKQIEPLAPAPVTAVVSAYADENLKDPQSKQILTPSHFDPTVTY
jgi:hypothetical protein